MIGNLIKIGGYILLAREAVEVIAAAQEYQAREIQKHNLKHAVTGSLIGVTLGFGAGVLLAPRSGKETREMIADSVSEKMQSLQDELEERREQLDELINSGREKLCPEETEEKKAGKG